MPLTSLELAALARLRGLVAPGGLLVLTVPFAEQPSADSFQRVYDEAGLRELLAGWEVRTSLRVGRTDRLTWELASRPWSATALRSWRPRRRARRTPPPARCRPAMGSFYDCGPPLIRNA